MEFLNAAATVNPSLKRRLIDELTTPSDFPLRPATDFDVSSSTLQRPSNKPRSSLFESTPNNAPKNVHNSPCSSLVAQRKPVSVAEFMCTCLVNALRDGGIIISYHHIDDIDSSQPTTSSKSSTMIADCMLQSTKRNQRTSLNKPSGNILTSGLARSLSTEEERNCSNDDDFSFLSKRPKAKLSLSAPSSGEDVIETIDRSHHSQNCFPEEPRSLPTMETAQRSFSLADRLLQVLERSQQSRGSSDSESSPRLVGGIHANRRRDTSNSSNSNSNSPPLSHGSPLGDDDDEVSMTTPIVLPPDLDEELRPDPAAAQLGPADHTTITPLHWASNLGHDDCVRYLLMAGWNVNLRDMCGYTPLHYAVRSGSVPAVRLLLRAGARPDSRNDLAMTPLHGAILDGALAAAKLLLSSGGNVDSRDINGQTALMFAAQSGRSPAEAVEMLLDFNADANLADMNGETALSCCYRLHRTRPNSAAIKSKLAVLIRASRPEAVRPLRWYATRDVDPEFAQLSFSITRLERLAALKVRQMMGRCYLPDFLEKCDLPHLIKELLLLKR